MYDVNLDRRWAELLSEAEELLADGQKGSAHLRANTVLAEATDERRQHANEPIAIRAR